MALPLVLAGKGTLATSEGENTDESSGMGGSYMTLECSNVFKGGVVAGLAGGLTFGFVIGLSDAATLDSWRRRSLG